MRLAGGTAEHRAEGPARDFDNIGHHGRGGGRLARAAPGKKEGACRARIHHHAIGGAVNIGQRRARPHHGGMNPLVYAGRARLPRHAQKLDAKAELGGKTDIVGA